MPAAALPIPTSSKPARDTVLYDGQCRFCRSQMALLRRLDLTGQLQLTSLHDPAVARDFPEIPPAELMREMFVVDRQGRAHGGVQADSVTADPAPVAGGSPASYSRHPAGVELALPGDRPKPVPIRGPVR